QVEAGGTLSAPSPPNDCSLYVVLSSPAIGLTVPDIGDSMTPVYFSGAVLASSGTNGVLPFGFEARVDGGDSRPELGEVALTNRGRALRIAEIYPLNAGARQSQVMLLIPNASPVLSIPENYAFFVIIHGAPGADGTFPPPIRIEAFLPPVPDPP